ncbi:hypothetical protein NC239_33770 [Streptomyces sp. G3]|uniref:hypothetical protein n=1 Tax=Streptomyces sp. G3 TaxID=690144 RepID=UPI002030E355|nr:hypothetical protein [Streptomyces sp. G3]MCM1943183.1 hypothetical protein [Streptomyces sp. G3]
MASNPTPQRVIRVDDETWNAYGQLCEEKGIARSADLRMYIKRQVAAWHRERQDEADRWNAEAEEDSAAPPRKRVVRRPRKNPPTES